MIYKEDLEIENNSNLEDVLQELKASLYNPEIAVQARLKAAEIRKTRKPFDAAEYQERLECYPSLSYLHLVTSQDD